MKRFLIGHRENVVFLAVYAPPVLLAAVLGWLLEPYIVDAETLVGTMTLVIIAWMLVMKERAEGWVYSFLRDD